MRFAVGHVELEEAHNLFTSRLFLHHHQTFHTFLKEISYRHSQMDKALPAESPAKGCMAIRHPAIVCEIKVRLGTLVVLVDRTECSAALASGNGCRWTASAI